MQIGKQNLDVVVRDKQLIVDGDHFNYDLKHVSGNYYLILLNGRSFSVVLEPSSNGYLRLRIDGQRADVRVLDEKDLLVDQIRGQAVEETIRHEVRAPMPGLVLSVAVDAGQEVAAGDRLLVLEAMKMENELRAPAPGVVKAVHVTAGTPVTKNQLLIEFET